MRSRADSRDAAVFVAILVVLLAVVFGPHLSGDFVWDDVILVRDNPNLDGWRGLRALLMHDIWGGGHQPPQITYRPVPMALTWGVVSLAGRSVVALRATNLVLHAATVLLFATWLLRSGLPRRGVAFTALLFAVHPVATEPVMWLVGSHELLASIGCLAALCVWPQARDARVPLRVALASLAMAIAGLSKEPYFVFPAVLLLVNLVETDPGRLRRAARVAFPCGALALVLLLRTALGISSRSAQMAAPLTDHLRHYATIVAHYARLALTFTEAPSTETYGPLGSIATGCVLAALAAMGVALAWASRRPAFDRNVIVGVGLFLLMLLPYVIALPRFGMFGNRYGYFPTVGLFTAGLALASPLATRLAAPPWRALVWASPAAIVASALLTAGDAQLWRTELSLFGRDLRDNPADPRTLYHYGHAVRVRDGCAAALPYYVRATEVDPTYGGAWHNVAGCLVELRRYDEALPAALAARRAQPDDAGSAYNLAVVRLAKGDRAKAAALLEEAIRLDPHHRAAAQLLAQLRR